MESEDISRLRARVAEQDSLFSLAKQNLDDRLRVLEVTLGREQAEAVEKYGDSMRYVGRQMAIGLFMAALAESGLSPGLTLRVLDLYDEMSREINEET